MVIKDQRGRLSKETPTIDLGISGRRVPVQSHLARIWETDEDFSESVGFLAAGLRGRDHCVLIGDIGDIERTLAILREGEIDVDSAIAERRLTVILREPTAEAMLASLMAALESALAAGASLVRVFGNVCWGRDVGPADAELFRYEARLTELAERFPCVILCLHPIDALTGPIARHGVLGTHARLLDERKVVTNPFFVPPEKFAQRLQAIAAELSQRQGEGEPRRRSAEILQAIFDNIPVMVSYMDATGRLLVINRAWERTLGWSLEEAQRIDFLSQLHPDPQRRLRVEEFVRRAEGRWEDFLVTTRERQTLETAWTRIALSDGTSIGLGLDVTERKRADAALRESEERYRILFEAGPLPKILFDPETLRIVAVNGRAIDHYGYSREEFLRMTILDYRPPEDAESVRNALREPHPPLWNAGVHRHLRKDGTLMFVDVTVAEVLIDGRSLLIAYIFDVTERRTAEERLQKSYAELQALSESLRVAREAERTQMARKVHDEVGQALTALRMDVAWLQRKRAAGVDDRAALDSKLQTMSALIDTTLDAVQRIATELRPAVLDELGLEAAIEWYVREFEQRTGIECSFRDELDERQTAPGSSTAIFRILQEALTNAARHSVATRVRIYLEADRDRLRLEIRDNGRGIPEDRIESSASLGLVGMRERARALGGDVEIRGAAGRGTTVAVTIPR